MQFDRRKFFELMMACGAASALPDFLQAQGRTAPKPIPRNTLKTVDSEALWSSYYDTERGGERGGTDEDRLISYLHYSQQEKKLRFSHEIQASELFPDPGDVSVTMNVTGIRLSQDDQKKFKNTQSAQLRMDLAQNKAMFNLIDKLAWASVAGLFVSQGKIPSIQDLSFSPSSTKDMILPGGTGLLGVNVSMAHRESKLYQVLQVVIKDVDKFAPVIGLPGISVTALDGFNQLYGKIEHRTTPLFQTTAPQRVFATQPSRVEASTTAGINMVSGDYILIPQEHVQEFQPHLGDFKLVSGYLVPQTTDENASLYQIASKITPDISYVAVNLKVSPPWQIGGPSAAPSASPASAAPSQPKKTETPSPQKKTTEPKKP